MRICITITEKEHKELKELSNTMGLSMGLVLRFALTEYKKKILKKK